MRRLIDANALYMKLVKMKDFGELTAKKAIRAVENAPTIDAEPVRHGKWIHRGCGVFACDKCGRGIGVNVYTHEKVIERFKYCPTCGARMDKE